ncbi:MAG TPA: Clp protease ClpP, partial [Thiohalobacter sp.]|nr:Clp protease ClpP [Thiohalobacter sp.]
SMLLMAGDTVSMASNALLMIHAPLTGAVGNAHEMRRVADMLDKFADAMMQTYRREGVDDDMILDMLTSDQDHYFTANEARELGLVDEITESLAVAASFDLSRYKDLPAAAAAFTRNKEQTMPTENKPKGGGNTTAYPKQQTPPAAQIDSNTVVNLDDVRSGVHQEVTARNQAVRSAFTPFLDRPGVQDLLNHVIDNPAISVEAAREQLLAKLGESAEPLATPGLPRVESGLDERDKRIDAMGGAILARVGAEKPDTQNPFRGMRLHEIARASLDAAGVNTRGMDIMDIAEKALHRGVVRGAQTTSDFDVILENTMHKLVLMGFQGVEPIYQRVCKIGDVTDFRDWRRIVPGLIGNLQSVNEHGEYLDKIIPDGEKNTIAAGRRGNIINITPEVIVNDDTGYINDMAMGLGAAGPRTIDRALATLLAQNTNLGPTLSDGKTLFHADHDNLVASGSGAAPSIALLDSAASSMAAQTAPGDDAEPLDISPEVAMVHRSLRGTMYEVVNAEFNDDSQKNQRKPNRVRGIVSDIVATTRLSNSAGWYLFADPMVAPVLEVVFLNGQREPRVVQEENFRTSGMAVKVEMPFGVGAIDYRGAFYNYGS